MTEAEEVAITLLPCTVCGRTFRPEVLSKHSIICEKQHAKKRRKFDSAKQRIQGTELAEFLGPPPVASKPRPKPPSPKKAQSRWKEKHEALVKTIRDGDRQQPVDHKQCPHCDRFFGPKAFDRHVAWCKDQHTKIQAPVQNEDVSKAKQRLQARTKYRAPSFRSQRSVTKEKYSPFRQGTGPSNVSTGTISSANVSLPVTSSTISPTTATSGVSSTAVAPAVNPSSATVLPNLVRNNHLPRVHSNVSSADGDVNSGGSRRVIPSPLTRQNSLPRTLAKRDETRKMLSTTPLNPRTSRTGSLSSQGSNSTQASINSAGGDHMASSQPENKRLIKTSLSTNKDLEKYDPFISAELQMMELLKAEEEQQRSEKHASNTKLDRTGCKLDETSDVKDQNSVNEEIKISYRRSSSDSGEKISTSSRRLSSCVDRQLSTGERRSSVCSDKRASNGDVQVINLNKERRASVDCNRVSCERSSKKSSPEQKDSGNIVHKASSPNIFQNSPSSAFAPLDNKNESIDNKDIIQVDLNSNSQPCKMLSLSTLSLCSEASLDALDPGLKQRCMSAATQPPPRITSSRLSKQRLNMHDLLFGLDPKSDSDSLNNNKQRKHEMERCEAQLLSSMVEFELLLNRNSDSPSPDQPPNLTDSAYSSLNRRWSPNGGDQNAQVVGGMNGGDYATSKFCHECGGKYPVPAAKFCCLCGVRRLAI